jgi:hypothetical protein
MNTSLTTTESTPLVSVIIPVYKVEDYLAECVDSVINQTYRNLEIILVDDGSPDGCGAMCDAYAAQDKRVRVLHKENGGLSSARNAGLEVMTGEWVLFVDSDDWIDLDTLETLLNRKDERADIIEFGYSYSFVDREDPQLLFVDMLCSGREALSILVEGEKPMGLACDKLYRSSVIKNLRFIEGRYYEDTPFVIEALWQSHSFQYLPKPYYHYRRNREGQITYEQLPCHLKHMYLNIESLLDKYADDSDLKLYLSTWYLTKAKQEFFIAYFKSHDEQSEFKRCLGSHWMLARSMPFIAQGKVQWLRMKAFQLSPILYTYLIVHVQPLIRRLLGKSTENLKVG